MGNAAWKVLSIVAGVVGARVAKAATDGTWKAATGNKPPQNPHDPDVSWKEAAAFALVSGSIMAISRMLAQKQAAAFYTKSAGHPPNALKADGKNK